MRVLPHRTKQMLLDLIDEYVKKGERCMDQCEAAYEDNDGYVRAQYNFWDGFHNCAQAIKREIESLEG